MFGLVLKASQAYGPGQKIYVRCFSRSSFHPNLLAYHTKCVPAFAYILSILKAIPDSLLKIWPESWGFVAFASGFFFVHFPTEIKEEPFRQEAIVSLGHIALDRESIAIPCMYTHINQWISKWIPIEA